METLKHNGKKELQRLFISGFLAGILCFLFIYGTKILDPTYADWLFCSEQDLCQHYIGWCHYRTSPWQFPIGMIDSLAAPLQVSLIWTDSIPLFALLCKPFRSILPETFQYFGWFGLLSLGLQGGLAAVLLRKAGLRRRLALDASLFFILSFTILQRMYYHTSLGAQWIILLALILWLEFRSGASLKKQAAAWSLMALLCVLIHAYFLPVTLAVMAASLAEKAYRKKQYHESALIAASYLLTALAALWIMGAFAKGSSAVGEGLGTFSSNLNTLINSQGHARLLPALPLYFNWQEEGFGYLGAGILFLILVMLLLRALQIRKRGWPSLPQSSELFLLGAALLLAAYAVSPIITLGGTELLHIPLPGFLLKLLNIFRSSGRFIWTPMYLIMLYTLKKLQNLVPAKACGLLLAAALVLQLYDVSAYALEKREYFAKTEHQYQLKWEGTLIDKNKEAYKHFLFMYLDNDILLPTAYYAYYRGMTVNNYYFARSYEEAVGQNIQKEQERLLLGKPLEDAVYVFQKDDQNLWRYPLHYYEIEDHIVGTAAPLQ